MNDERRIFFNAIKKEISEYQLNQRFQRTKILRGISTKAGVPRLA